MSHQFHSSQPPNRAQRGALLREYLKRSDSPWRNEARLGFQAFFMEGRGFLPPASESLEYSKRLLEKLESAAEHVGCGLCGVWLAGIHLIPGQELIHTLTPEGFVLLKPGGSFSPFVVGHEEMAVQCGEHPFVFRYTIDTDLAPLFRGAIIPESFF